MAIAVGIDFGTKRMGLAITDTARIIASPYKTLHPSEVMQELKLLHEKYVISDFILGDPKKLSGEETHSSQMVNEFAVHLSRQFKQIPVHRVDERFTSKMAMNSMLESGHSKKKRQDKAMLDQISAAIILQSWLDGRS